jgi:hypothetical protein
MKKAIHEKRVKGDSKENEHGCYGMGNSRLGIAHSEKR